jgi:colicin import membrane protein
MRLKPVFDKWLAGFYAVLVHALVLGILLISLDWSPEPKTDTSEPESVQAVVVDESRVAAEITRLKEQERLRREQEAARQERLEQEAREAEMRRKQEEQRLANIQQQLEEQRQRQEAKLEEQRKSEAEQLAALRAQGEAEAKRVAKLKEEHAALVERRAEQKKQIAEREAARKAKVEAARKLLAKGGATQTGRDGATTCRGSETQGRGTGPSSRRGASKSSGTCAPGTNCQGAKNA